VADGQSGVAPKAVLLAGSGERLTEALVEALERRRVSVDTTDASALVGQAYVLAPDLVVLLGDAAADGGKRAAAELAAKRATASIPVVVVRDGALGERLDAFRHGVVAVVQRSASADEMAKRIAEIAREVPDRSGEVTRGGTEASVDELVALFAEQLRTGILSVAAGSDEVSAQVVLHAETPVEDVVGELVERLRPLIGRAQGPLRYEFFESAAPRLASLDLELEPDEGVDALDGVRVVLVEQRAHRADSLAQDLRAAGAQVVVADGAGVGLERAKRLDPQVVVLDGAGEDGWALGALRALRRDVHLRWASLLVVREEQLWRRPDGRPDLAALAGAVAPLVEGEREVAGRARREDAFDVRVELVGPVRLLRALADTGEGLRLTVHHPSVQLQIDLADGLVAGAVARSPGSATPRAQGPVALATFCALGAGRVKVERKEAPASTNIMAPASDALAAADAEESLLRPSLPPSFPPGAPAVDIPRAPALPRDRGPSSDDPYDKLETLLSRLQEILPEAEAVARRAPPASPSPPSAALPPRPAAFPPRPSAGLPPRSRSPEPPAPPSMAPPAPSPPAPDAAPPTPAPPTSARAVPGSPAAEARVAEAPLSAPTIPEPSVPEPLPEAQVSAPSIPAPPPRSAPAAPPRPAEAPGPSSLDAAAVTARAPARPASLDAMAPALGERGDESTARLGTPDAWKSDTELPMLPREAPPGRRSSTGRWIAVGAAGTLLLLVGAGAAAWLASSGETAAAEDEVTSPTPRVAEAPEPTPPSAVAAPAPAPDPAPDPVEEVEEPPDEPVAGAAPPPEPAPAPDAVHGPLDDSPIEGSSDDFSLSALGIEEAPPPRSRRRRARTIRELIRTANILRNRHELGRAEELYRRVLSLDAENPRATAGLTRLYMERGDAGQAVLFAQRLVRLRPAFASNYVLLGDTFELGHNPTAARRAWTRAVEIEPRWGPARARLARLR